MNCSKCGGPISPDEVGLTQKLVNRGTGEFFCYACLSAHFKVTTAELREMVEHFRAAGCHLFVPHS